MTVLNNIEMMNKLMKQAQDLRIQQVSANRKTKQEMLEEAKKKIRNYFDEVLRVIPFKSFNIEVNGASINVYIRKDENLYVKSNTFSKQIAFENPSIVIIKTGDSYSSNYYTVQDEFKNSYWNSSMLNEMSEKAILLMANNFELVKSSVEEQIAKSIEKRIQEDSKRIKQDTADLETLGNFLN
jgi:hypothetical protein